MKQCPRCGRAYDDELSFCLDDGTPLITAADPEATLVMGAASPNPLPTLTSSARRQPTSPTVAHVAVPSSKARTGPALYIVIALLALIAGGGLVALLKSGARNTPGSNESSTQRPESMRSPATNKPAAAPTAEKSTNRVEVPANRMWTDTGVVLATGDAITVHASGQVNGSLRFAEVNRWVGPDGWAQPPAISSSSKASWVLGRTSYMCLTGRIGANGKPFKVGSNYSMRANSSGILFLGINDELIDENGNLVSDNGLGWQDNSGSFVVQITITK